MSLETFRRFVREALALAEQAVVLAEARFPGVHDARKSLAQKEAELAAARQAVKDARYSQRAIQLALDHTKDAMVLAAKESAEEVFEKAEVAEKQALAALAVSEAEFEEPLKPINKCIKLRDQIKALLNCSIDGRAGYTVLLIYQEAAGFLEAVKAAIASIGAAEEEVLQCSKQLEIAKECLASAQRADQYVQAAYASVASQAIDRARSATGTWVVAATDTHILAKADLEAAQAKLKASLMPIQVYVELKNKLAELLEEANRLDAQFKEEQEEKYRNDSRTESPCQCSWNYTCSYCYDQQSNFGKLHRDDDRTS